MSFRFRFRLTCCSVGEEASCLKPGAAAHGGVGQGGSGSFRVPPVFPGA